MTIEMSAVLSGTEGKVFIEYIHASFHEKRWCHTILKEITETQSDIEGAIDGKPITARVKVSIDLGVESNISLAKDMK